MTNDQANAANVLEGTLDLIRQVLLKHETAVIAEFRVIIEAKKHELKLVYAERDRMRDLLRDEFNRGHRLESPWDCFEHDCPGFKQPMRKSCGCYRDATKVHIADVLKEINQS